MADEKPVEKHPVAEALRESILKLAKDGDAKKGGALTEEVLQRIMRVAKTGREVLVSLNASPTSLANMVKRPKNTGYFSPVFGGNSGDEDDELGEATSGQIAPFATASPSENFGMTAIREIIAAVKNVNGTGPSPSKLVEALAIARDKGLDDVAKDLEIQLGMAKKALPAAPVKPVDKEKKEEVPA